MRSGSLVLDVRLIRAEEADGSRRVGEKDVPRRWLDYLPTRYGSLADLSMFALHGRPAHETSIWFAEMQQL